MSRTYCDNITDVARHALQQLIKDNVSVAEYQKAMYELGAQLGQLFCQKHQGIKKPVLVVSTAEDTDYLVAGFIQVLTANNIKTKIAVFWNHHYSLPDKSSVAPIVNQFLEDDYQTCGHIAMMKSIISGSCVIHTNLAALINEIVLVNIADIAVLAPVMYEQAPHNLNNVFTQKIAEKFSFYSLAIDSQRDDNGIVYPGIGGEVYGKLGLADQPALMGTFIPNLVRQKLFALNTKQ